MASAPRTRSTSASARHPKSPAGGSSATFFGPLVQFARELDLIQTINLLTLFLVVVFAFDHWLFRIVSSSCLLVFVLWPGTLRRPLFWFTVAVTGTITIVLTWEHVDNHKYLLVYWSWVLGIVHLFREPEQQRRILQFNARFFLCLIFLAASLQKLSAPSFRSGEMFEHYLYVDQRFTAFGKLIGVDPSVGDAVKRRLNYLRSPFAEVEGNGVYVAGSDQARSAAVGMTWWDVCVQGTIGALLLFGRRRTDLCAHVLLLFFILTTYIPAPVFGFGWTLAIMGLALAKDRFARISVAYLMSFFAILLYQLPWREWVLGMPG